MVDERFPNWDIDVEKGTIWSITHKRYIGSINIDNYIKVTAPKGYKHKGVHQYIWMVANGCDIPEGYEIHHIDGNRQNNCISNLDLVESVKHQSEHKIGRIVSEDTKRKLSIIASELINEKNPFYGKHHSEETKRKISESKKGKIPWNKGLKMKKDVA